ncbi:hypothetical protein GVAV_003509 [Gurleya vavrai]
MIYSVEASALNCFKRKNKPNVTIEPFVFTYSSYEINAEKIEYQFLQIYHFLALEVEQIKDFIMLTIEPTNEFFNYRSNTTNKIEFIFLIKKYILESKCNYLKSRINDIISEDGYKIHFKRFSNSKNSFRKKIETSTKKHKQIVNIYQKKSNTLEIFENHKYLKINRKKFSDTHIFFIAEDASDSDLNFLYDSIQKLNILISAKQSLPSFNLTFLAKCKFYKKEIEDLEIKTSFNSNSLYFNNSYENKFEIYIISQTRIYFKQRLHEFEEKNEFIKIIKL